MFSSYPVYLHLARGHFPRNPLSSKTLVSIGAPCNVRGPEEHEHMTPTTLLAFERRHPSNNPEKHERIRHMLGITPVRYAVLLRRAAESVEGIAADPVTARIVRERAEMRTQERAQRTVA